MLQGRGEPDIVCTDGTYPDQQSERALPLSLWGNLNAKLPDSGKFLGLECSTWHVAGIEYLLDGSKDVWRDKQISDLGAGRGGSSFSRR